MEIIILGSGTSTGVPVLGCECNVCSSTSTKQKNSRTRSSALIKTDQGHNILIDAASDLRQQLLREQITKIDAVLFTHAHADHILGLEDLRALSFRREDPIPIYGTDETLAGIKKCFFYIFERDPNYKGNLAKLETHQITDYQDFDLFGVKITPFLLMHGNVKVTGFKIKDLAYATDCKIIPDQSLELMRNLELLILDALHDEEHFAHFTVDQAVEQARQISAKKSFLIHMSHKVDYYTRNQSLPENIKLAFDGLRASF